MPRLFGTNGVRGVVGQDMTPALALDLGRALGTWLYHQSHWTLHGPRAQVLVGTDHRTSGQMLSQAVAAGLMATGCDVRDAGPAPTPALQLGVKAGDVDAGVIVTASHNPPEFNGIKFCRADGREMTPDLEDEIEGVYFARTFRDVSWDAHGHIQAAEGLVAAYHEAVKAQVDVEAIRARRFTVALDTANGAACGSLPALLGDLGCRVVTLNAQPDGTFPGHPSEPVAEYAGPLSDLVRTLGADVGVMVDGDADRAVFLDESGTYVPGDKSLTVLAADAVRQNGGGVVCTPVSSSSCVEELVEAAGGTLSYTIVGSPKVAAAMLAEGAVFGGEENGGLIFPKHQYTRDAAMAVAAFLDLMVRSGKRPSALFAEVPEKHVVKLKTKVPDDRKAPALLGVKARVSDGAVPVGVTVSHVDDRDGLKVYVDGGWVLVRPSGTEPIMRVYAESSELARAQVLAEGFLALLEEVVNA